MPVRNRTIRPVSAGQPATGVQRASNIEHVARLAGVSRATAARAFSEPTRVAEKTRARILEVADSLHYTPNPLARGLAGGTTHSVGMLLSLAGAPGIAELTRNISKRLLQKGYVCFVADSGIPAEESRDALQTNRSLIQEYVRRGVDGLILQHPDNYLAYDNCMDTFSQFRSVTIIDFAPRDISCDQIILDRHESYCRIAEHFVATGRRRPAIIIKPNNLNEHKIQAYGRVFQSHGIRFDQDQVIDAWRNDTDDICNNELVINTLDARFAGRPFPFDCLMCSNDIAAMAAMSWLRAHNLRVPQDVAVCGFNNEEVTRFSQPPLASVDRRDRELASAVVDLFSNRIAQPDREPQRVNLPMEFVWRTSAGGRESMSSG